MERFETGLTGSPVLSETQLPDKISADYELISCCQYADHKQTYLIRRKADQRKLILKCAQGEYLSFLHDEAVFLRDRKFSFLPCYISYYEEAGSGFLFREYIEGSTIWELVERKGPFARTEALVLLRKTAGMLRMLHDEDPPVIHRDLKPQNIVLTEKGECYLIDMGTARQFEENKPQDTVVTGTRMVAAPEQFGYSQSDERTDVYAFGVLMNYMLTGSMKAVPDKTISGRMRKIILKCTAYNPEQRYQNISQVETQLDRLLRRGGKRYKVSGAAEALLMTAALLICISFAAEQIKQHIQPTAHFEDALLEAAVRAELGKEQGEVIYLSELAGVRQILICGDEVLSDYKSHYYYMKNHMAGNESVEGRGTVQDISILRQMPNLSVLMLDGQLVSDLTPLQDLNLEIVSLCDCPVSDITPLKNSASLSELYIAQTQVMDLGALADKEGLRVLDISYTPVRSLDSVSGLEIEILSLFDTSLKDYTAIGSLPLRTLRINEISSGTVEIIGGIESMEAMTIYHSNISDLNVFGRLSNLNYLDLWGNNLQNLDGIGKLSGITSLNVGENPIAEIEIPPQIHLTFIGIKDSGVRDMSFLNEMPYLTHIDVNYEQEKLLYELIPEPSFEILVSD